MNLTSYSGFGSKFSIQFCEITEEWRGLTEICNLEDQNPTMEEKDLLIPHKFKHLNLEIYEGTCCHMLIFASIAWKLHNIPRMRQSWSTRFRRVFQVWHYLGSLHSNSQKISVGMIWQKHFLNDSGLKSRLNLIRMLFMNVQEGCWNFSRINVALEKKCSSDPVDTHW